MGSSRVGLAQPSVPRLTPALPVDSARPVYPAPMLRPLVIQSGLLPARRITTEHEGRSADREASPGHQLRVVGVAPLLITTPVVLLAGVNYLREQGSYRRAADANGESGSYTYVREDLSFSLTAVRQDSLLQRPVTYLASVTGASRRFDWPEKFVGGLTALLTLRRTPETKLSAGLTVQLNPSVKIPISPVVSYWHRFGQSAWEVDALLPLRAHLRRPLLANKCWLSVGTEVMSTHSFGAGTVPGFSSTFEANSLSLQTGALFEYAVNPYFMLGIRGGLDTPVSMWVAAKNSSRVLVEAEAENAAYVGLTMSVTVPARKR
ncbi:hypothetical protein [Hymenobacter properus]|uniref:Uncharacterized protein n=1 Tax=Hymenobacter properus TaxID=2791026 RepID=A0A931BGM8_9BACT|nr:hypothetical protein [Hymenobacter properus]MBF9141947.1 hypothetical protein [Hymenobacter properus]MBR7720754.1 hypothetical protein [Microvirga sp. SRT04]